MILQALADHYEAVASRGEIARPGWQQAKVSFALQLTPQGEPTALLYLAQPVQRNKKTVNVPRELVVPLQNKKTSGVLPNFLCDNAGYILGLDTKGKPERAISCFEASREHHRELLREAAAEVPEARAILAFFESWEPRQAEEDPIVVPYLNELKAGANIVFRIDGRYAQDVEEIAALWDRRYAASDAPVMQCLVTGRTAPIARLHAAIKGVPGAQTSGASLVSFNAPAYESYGREGQQGLNAPVSEHAAFAYTTALNQLLADQKHRVTAGNAMVVFWAKDAQQAPADWMALSMNPQNDEQKTLHHILTRLKEGEPIAEDVSLDTPFFILALSPNAARLSIRFFLQNSFGHFMNNLRRHYERMEIDMPSYEPLYLSPYWMLRETVNPNASDKTPVPTMAAMTLDAILLDRPYPAALYTNVMLRLKAEREVTRGKAAIIKAYLSAAPNTDVNKEVLTVSLNEQTDYTPYVLGRIFSMLENIQDAATGASTVKDSYFNAACATPGAVLPRLIKLKNSHMRVLMREKPGLAVTLEKQLSEQLQKIDAFPARLTLDQQGAFILGYYHQQQKRYEKKEDKKNG